MTGSLLGLSAAFCLAQDPAALDRIAQDHVTRNQVPGAVVMIVRGDRIVYAKGFGVASVETREPVSPDHLFRVGSTTKMMVAATVVKLSEETRLRLTDRVDQHVPNLHPSIGQLTAHQLLSHTAGLLDRAPMFGPQDDSALGANVRSWKEDMLFTTPGKVYSYSNPGYALAGRLIESVSGRSFADALEEFIFKPAGMSRTTFRPTVAMTYPLAQGHVDGAIARPAGNNAAYWPAGSMFTSGNDFARFAIAMLHEGQVQGKRVLSAKTVQTMTTPKVRVDGAAEGRFYGYGLSLDPDFGIVEHSGGRIGYASHLVLHPKDKLGVIVLMNRSGAPATALAHEVADHVLGQRRAPRVLSPSHSADISTYAGIYRNDPESVITVKAGQAPNQLAVTMSGRTMTMSPARSGNCFESDGRPPVTTVCFTNGSYAHAGGRSFAKQQQQ